MSDKQTSINWENGTIKINFEIVDDEVLKEEQALGEALLSASLREWHLRPRRNFPYRAPGTSRLTWLHRLGPDERCGVGFPWFDAFLPIRGAVSMGFETMLLIVPNGTIKIMGPMPVEIIDFPLPPMGDSRG